MDYATYLKTIAKLQSDGDLKNHLEALELVASCARDIVAAWPQFSLRQISTMTQKVDLLKQALELAAK